MTDEVKTPLTFTRLTLTADESVLRDADGYPVIDLSKTSVIRRALRTLRDELSTTNEDVDTICETISEVLYEEHPNGEIGYFQLPAEIFENIEQVRGFICTAMRCLDQAYVDIEDGDQFEVIQVVRDYTIMYIWVDRRPEAHASWNRRNPIVHRSNLADLRGSEEWEAISLRCNAFADPVNPDDVFEGINSCIGK